MKQSGIEVHETILTFDDFKQADEVFISGNMSKVTPVTAFDEVQYQEGPITRQIRNMYWDWATSVGT
jgi:branched-chain amino acid aminotransferase